MTRGPLALLLAMVGVGCTSVAGLDELAFEGVGGAMTGGAGGSGGSGGAAGQGGQPMTGGFGGQPASAYSMAVLEDGPVAYWRLGEQTGTTAADISGNGLHGIYVGAPGLGTPGLIAGDSDGAVTLDGASQTVIVAADELLDFDSGEPFSLEAWIQVSVLVNGAAGDLLQAHRRRQR